MTPENDQRQFHRIFFNAKAELSCQNKQWACQLLDISLRGCLLRFQSPWEQKNIEALYALTLQLSETTAITMNLSVSHVIGNEVGFKCEHIDLDSISALRRMVELNLGDSTLLERDLIALCH